MIDVAAQHGGAQSILERFLADFRRDAGNEYVVVLSTPVYEDEARVRFVNVPWVKRSYLHRLFFDNVYVHKLIRTYRPDKVLSLQNKAVRAGGVPQEVYYQNILPLAERRFGLKESKELWLYQNVIGRLYRRSLRRVARIYVQADWIKNALADKWKIAAEKISVVRPEPDPAYAAGDGPTEKPDCFFYPANGAVYKNHETLLRALQALRWDEGREKLPLVLTCRKDELPAGARRLVDEGAWPVVFAGRLTREDMIEQYRRSVLVFPSYLETVGLPLLEAKALRRPILAADREYARETLGQYGDVLYFDPLDVPSIGQAVATYLRRG